MESNEFWNYESITGSHSRLLLSMCCMLGAAWCWYLPVWAKDWLGKLELETNRAKALRKTWIRPCLCIVFVRVSGLFVHTGSVQTGLCQLLGPIFVVVLLVRLQTEDNILRLRRTALLTHGLLQIGYNWGAPNWGAPIAEDIWWSPIARWHLCSAVMYTSLIDHLQDSFFILAVTLAASPTGLSKVIGLTLTSTVALCGKLMWCRLQLENRRSIEAALRASSNE